MQTSNMLKASFFVVAAVVLSGCGDKSSQDRLSRAPHDNEHALVTVAGEPITDVEFDAYLNKLFGEDRAATIPEEARKQALESMVMARAVAQAAAKELSVEDRRRLDAQVDNYRDQLLLTGYMRAHVTPEPVSSAMVEAYYKQHPERFGGSKVRTFEMIIASGAMQEVQRNKLLEALRDNADQKDWPGVVIKLRKKGMSLDYRKGVADDALLDERLRSVVMSVPVTQRSEPGLLNRRPFIIRVLGEQERPPRPLEQVSSDIRRALAAIQVKEAVKEATDPIMKRTEVKYVNQIAQ